MMILFAIKVIEVSLNIMIVQVSVTITSTNILKSLN